MFRLTNSNCGGGALNNKAFTLIELLAVIIVLAIIALIAAPLVLNILEDAKEESRKRSVAGYADSVKLSYAEEIINNTGKPLDELASSKMQGDEVLCEFVKYDSEHGPLLYNCKVKEKGNYCYFKGIVYDIETEQCKNVYRIIFEKGIPYNTPEITVSSQTPSETEYAQNKTIKVKYPKLTVVEENYYIKSNYLIESNNAIELNNILSICGINELPSKCTDINTRKIEPNTWYRVSGDISFTVSENLTIEAIIGNLNDYGTKAVYNETKIDTSAPIVTIKGVSTTSDKAFVYATCEDSESGISKIEYSKDNGITYQESEIFKNLETGNKYIFKAKCINGAGTITESEPTDEITPQKINKPIISQISQIPMDTKTYPTYAQERTIRIKYDENNIDNPEYYFKSSVKATVLEGMITHFCDIAINPQNCKEDKVITELEKDRWYKTDKLNVSVIFKQNGYLYAQTKDSSGNIAEATFTVTNIDTSEPTLTLASTTKDASRIIVDYTANDSESGIVSTTCEYGTSINYGSNGKIVDNTCTLSSLTSATTYYYKITTTNGSGLTTIKTGSAITSTVSSPTITQYSQMPNSGTWAQQRVMLITYGSTPHNYFKSSVDVTVPSGIVEYVCGTGTNPGTCTTSNTTTLSAGYWYRTTKLSVAITYKTNGIVFATASDGSNFETINPEKEVNNIDSTEPLLSLGNPSIATDNITVPFTASDPKSGIVSTTCEYGTSINYGRKGTLSGNNCVFTGLNQGTIYYYKITTTNGSGLTTMKTNSATTLLVQAPTITQYSQMPSSGTWVQQRVMLIKYDSTGISKPRYYYKIDDNNWIETTNDTITVTYVNNGTLHAKTTDEKGNENIVSKPITYIDPSAPNLVINTATSTTNSITIPFTSNDPESGVVNTTCEYGTSIDYGSKGTLSGNNCVFTGLNQGTTYYYKITTTNGSGLTTTKTNSTKTLLIQAPSVPDLVTEHDTGVSNTDNKTKWWYQVRIQGTAEPGMTIQLRISNISDDIVGTATVDSNGNWSIPINLHQNQWNNIYAWSVDSVGNSTKQTNYLSIYSDTTLPTVPTITYNGGSNTCSWKNDYNLTLLSTDETGIWKYQINHYETGSVDREIGNNFVPEFGYSTCTDRYRAVDNVGNESNWTEPQHIHMKQYENTYALPTEQAYLIEYGCDTLNTWDDSNGELAGEICRDGHNYYKTNADKTYIIDTNAYDYIDIDVSELELSENSNFEDIHGPECPQLGMCHFMINATIGGTQTTIKSWGYYHQDRIQEDTYGVLGVGVKEGVITLDLAALGIKNTGPQTLKFEMDDAQFDTTYFKVKINSIYVRTK